jgi:RNA polymerase sigma factor, sigma-70 family
MEYLFEQFMKDIRPLRRMSDKEEEACFSIIKTTKNQRIKQAAVEKIAKNHILFVVSCAKKYVRKNYSLADLINEGMAGMYHAINTYDSSRNIKFISYAVWWIRQSMLSFIIGKSRTIHIPANQQYRYFELQRKMNETGLSLEDLVTNKSELDAMQLVHRVYDTVSLNTPVIMREHGISVETDHTLGDTVPDPKPNAQQKLLISNRNKQLKKFVMTNTTTKENDILNMFFGTGGRDYTLNDVGELTGYSKERVRQIKNKALRRLRNKLPCDEFPLD